MAACFIINSTGQLEANNVAPADCTAYIVEDATDYLTSSIFTIPDPSDLGAAWSAGFVLPMTVGLVAWAISLLVNYFND